jgi:2-polyprenyl-3-methyl-5-hydroxy-6-metoxy-1,4-benzoquinol methylase
MPAVAKPTHSRGDEPTIRVLGEGAEWADGSETRVLSILRKARDRSSSSDELAEKIRDWPTRYHFSRLRSRVLSPLKIAPGTRVLDLGGGTGPLSRRLGELGADVTLLDGSEERARAAAERCRDLDNVSVAVGTVSDLDDAEPFDIVLAVGLLEYAGSTADGPEAMLRQAAGLLKPDGAVAVGIENAIGLKYLLGYAEDHVGLPWVGWEGYLGIEHVRTYSRPELASLLNAAGLPEQAWFFPFPDYKLPTGIVSEAGYELGRPDVVDSIVPQPCVPDSSLPVLLCDARAAHRTMLRAGLGRDVANSFLVVASRESAGLDRHVDRETLAWLTGSERSARFLRSRRLVSQAGSLAIVDDTSSPAMVEADWLAQRRFPVVPFEEGEPLDFLISEALAAGDAARTRELLTLWTEHLREQASEAGADSMSPFAAEAPGLALPGDFLDSQPANFLLHDGRIHRIDVEWEARGSVDLDLVCARGLFHFVVDLFTRGISTRRVGERDVSSFLTSLAEAAGLENRARAVQRLPEAEAALQALVRGWPIERSRAEIERILRSAPEELAVQAGAPTASPTRPEREAELEAELAQLRLAHEAQARHLIAQRLALAEEVEREVTTLREESSTTIAGLREEIEWRKGVMESQEKAIENHRQVVDALQNSRSFRYTEPLRRIASLLRR